MDIYGGGIENGQGRQYDIARDGRFLINTVLDDGSSPITVLMNWKPPAKSISSVAPVYDLPFVPPQRLSGCVVAYSETDD